jgi:hypothetical protein
MMQLCNCTRRARAILSKGRLPHKLDNEEVNAAEAAVGMGAWRAQAVARGADGGMRSNRVRKSAQVAWTARPAAAESRAGHLACRQNTADVVNRTDEIFIMELVRIRPDSTVCVVCRPSAFTILSI